MFILHGDDAHPVEPGTAFVVAAEDKWIIYLLTSIGIVTCEVTPPEGASEGDMMAGVFHWVDEKLAEAAAMPTGKIN